MARRAERQAKHEVMSDGINQPRCGSAMFKNLYDGARDGYVTSSNKPVSTRPVVTEMNGACPNENLSVVAVVFLSARV
jgi:hypothetical protein